MPDAAPLLVLSESDEDSRKGGKCDGLDVKQEDDAGEDLELLSCHVVPFKGVKPEPDEDAGGIEDIASSDSSECVLDDSLAIMSWSTKKSRKKAKKLKKKEKKAKKKRKEALRKQQANGDKVGLAAAIAQVNAMEEEAQKKPKLTPKQRRRLRAILAAEELARSALEETARRAAEWRDSRDKAAAEWGVMPKLRGARPKKKAKKRQVVPLIAEASEASKAEAERIENGEAAAFKAGVPEDAAEEAMPDAQSEAGDLAPQRSDAENGDVDPEAEAESEDAEQKPRKKAKPTRIKNFSKEVKDQIREALELADDANFLDFDLFDPRKAYELAYGRRERGDGEGSESGSDLTSSEEEGEREEKQQMALEEQEKKRQAVGEKWQELNEQPKELRPRDEFETPERYIYHFIQYVLGAWKRILSAGTKIEAHGGTDHFFESTFNSKTVLKQTEDAMRPLFEQLRGKSVSEEMVKNIESVVCLAAEREYSQSIQAYVVITMGRKLWHQSLPQIMQQQNHGGAISRILKQSAFIEYDKDPIIRAYVTALKRIVQLCQWLHPPTDPTKRFM